MVNWVNALQTYFKLKKFYDAGKTVKGLLEKGKYLEKIDGPSLEELKPFRSADLNKAIKDVEAADKEAIKVLGTPFEVPECTASGQFMNVLKMVKKHGHDAKQTRAALEAYRKGLGAYHQQLLGLEKELKDLHRELPQKAMYAENLADVSMEMSKTMMACAKIPNFSGTAQNAMFVSLSSDARTLAGVAGNLHRRLMLIVKANNQAIQEVRHQIKQNNLWIQWAVKDATNAPDSVPKNAKAKTPKK